jgi:hypothetical protein
MTLKSISMVTGALLMVVALTRPASAAGTAMVWQRDGSEKTYANVSIRLAREELALTTSDGVGSLVIGKAACTKAAVLVRCLPYDATLFQNGEKKRIALRTGTVWLNPTTSRQLLPYSSAQIPPHGVLISITSKTGTYLSLNGTVDEVQR